MISIKGLKINFGDKLVLDSIVKDFAPSLVHGVIGLNGSGKTTFFNVLTKTIKTDIGILDYNGRPLLNKNIGYLETVNFFYSKITGNEYLKIFTQTNTNFNLDSLQVFFKLPLDELIEGYSTGMKKKLALLAILKQDKEIYLFDEPFNGLDLESNKILELIILTLKEKGKTIFISSHIISPLLCTCDEIHFLESGRFKKTYTRPDFDKIDEELFKEFKEQYEKIITDSI